MIHDRLKEVYDEFDQHCRINNIDYSIDADYYNVQGYRLLDSKDIVNTLRHMSNFVKDRQVELSYNGSSVNYNDLKENDFNVSTYNPLFKFTILSIQEEEEMQEDQFKGPTNKLARSQSQHPSSFRRNKTAFTYEGDGEGGKKKKKKKKKKENDTFEEGTFQNRLDSSIQEMMDLSFKEPDILFTRNGVESEANDTEELPQKVDDCIELEKEAVRGYLDAMESTDNEAISAQLEIMIEGCANRIKTLTEMRDGTWAPKPFNLNL